MTWRRLGLLAIILVAFWLRVWQLPQTPPGLWYDEAYYSMDATWLLDGGPWRLFFAGNNGREPIFIYGQALFIWLFGCQPLTSRLIGPLVGTLTVPLVYVLARRLALSSPRPAWLPYLAAAGLATSFWHLGLSRSGFRGILLPLVVALVFYLFWRAWHEVSWKGMVLAGLALGLGQYTYLAARLVPLVFVFFAVAWSVLNRRDLPRFKGLWLTLGVMAIVSAIVFAPLGWIFYQNPALFSARTGDVFFTPDSPAELLAHLGNALRLFVDGGDPNWRHHLPGRPMMGWLGWLGFWPGLFLCLRRLRQAPYLFLGVALLTLYTPALLAVPPAHALRLSALLPVYFVIFALGMIELAAWLAGWGAANRLDRFLPGVPVKSSQFSGRFITVVLTAVMGLELGLTVFDYFGRWAGREETYVEYNGPLVDLVNSVIDQTHQTAVIIPLQLYLHATTRYMLHDQFVEQTAPPNLSGPVRLVTWFDRSRVMSTVSIPDLPAWVWLERDAAGHGFAYVSRPPYPAEQTYLNNTLPQSSPEIYRDRFDRPIAFFYPVTEPARLEALFTQAAPARQVTHLTWAGLIRLEGYEVLPDLVRPGQPITLTLYWRSLTDTTFDYRLFLQVIDGAGRPITQWEDKIFHEDMYRWRPEGLLTTQHTLWLGAEVPPGPYLVRMGFFDDKSGIRLPLQGIKTGLAEDGVDQVQLGLFYVSVDGTDPRQPAIPLAATFGEAVELIGVTLPSLAGDDSRPETAAGAFRVNSTIGSNQAPLPVTFHWRSLLPTAKPYTVFLQLLNKQDQVISSWDNQPFGGLYPTYLWSPGEVIAETFLLPLPETGLPPGTYRLITGFYDRATGQRLPAVTTAGGSDWARLAELTVEVP